MTSVGLYHDHNPMTGICQILALSFVVLSLSSSPLFAQSGSWQEVYALDGLGAQAIEVVPGGTYFVASLNAGVYRSTDDGMHWSQHNTGLTNLDVRALLHLPGGIVLAGTWGGGIFRSTNNGVDWAPSNSGISLQSRNIQKIRKADDGTVYAITTSDPVYRSTDNGSSWVKVELGFAASYGCDLQLDANGQMFLGVFGFFCRSTDGGAHWEKLLNEEVFDDIGIAPNGHIFVTSSTSTTSKEAFWRSTDGGTNWVDITSSIISASDYVFQDSTIIVASGKSVYVSRDDGMTWIKAGSGLIASPVLALVQNETGDLFAGMDGHLFRRSRITTDALVISAGSGKWSDPATWDGGIVPGMSTNVTITAGHRVTIDTSSAVCNDLTVNPGGTVQFRNDGIASGILLYGSLTVKGNDLAGGTPGVFMCDSTTSPAFIEHSLTVCQHIKVESGIDSSGIVRLRMGTNGVSAAGCRLNLAGRGPSLISLQKTMPSSSEVFNAITMRKNSFGTVMGMVVLESGNLFMSNNATVGPAYLTLDSGRIATMSGRRWVVLAPAAEAIIGGSQASFVAGALGRGIPPGGGELTFPLSDFDNYRPFVVSPSGNFAPGQYLVVTNVRSNANTGTSTFVGPIDKVSALGYQEIRYYRGDGGPSVCPIVSFSPSYGARDGVAPGNTDLRVAYSTDNRGTWKALAQTTPHMTSLSSPPTTIVPMPLTPGDTLRDGGTPIHVALARLAGTTTNPLDLPHTAVDGSEGQISTFELYQNFPNPFNPTTTIAYQLPVRTHVRLGIFNVLGQEVMALQNGEYAAGPHVVRFDASGLPSGVYFYRLEAGVFTQTRKCVLVR